MAHANCSQCGKNDEVFFGDMSLNCRRCNTSFVPTQSIGYAETRANLELRAMDLAREDYAAFIHIALARMSDKEIREIISDLEEK